MEGGIACVIPAVPPDPAAAEEIRVTLEEPRAGQIYSGIGNLRGWAVYDFGVERIAVFIDGDFKFYAPYGGTREDVGNAFPETPKTDRSGFGLAYGYSNLSSGEHTITVVAESPTGDFNLAEATFTVESLDKKFIPQTDVVNPVNSQLLSDEAGITIRNLSVDGKSYDVRLEWQTATQGFEIIDIE